MFVAEFEKILDICKYLEQQDKNFKRAFAFNCKNGKFYRISPNSKRPAKSTDDFAEYNKLRLFKNK